MKKSVHTAMFISMLFGLAGCGRIVDWSKKHFHQGKDIKSEVAHAQTYLRSVNVYSQFTTKGMFDALWLASSVRTAYTNVHAHRRGKSEEQKNVFLRRQLEENNHFISFYLLSLHQFPLGNSDSEWELFLNIDGNNFRATEIKSVDLNPEYHMIFDSLLTPFKQAYLLKFDALDAEDHRLITPQTKNVALHFRSMKKEAALTWQFDKDGKLKKKRVLRNSTLAKDLQGYA